MNNRKMDDMFDGLDPVDIAVSCLSDDEDYIKEDAELLNEEEVTVEDIEEYDEEDDIAIGIDDVAGEEFRKARDCGWETQIDDEVEDTMMEDEDVDDDDVEFDDGWPDNFDKTLSCDDEEEC